MKRSIVAALVAIITAVIVCPVHRAEAAPDAYACVNCCDASGVPRCYIPVGPCGFACYCNGIPGTGYSC